ncbi:hypothetical protein J5N97_016625 [Dioscorea zingiberensis]|uniref:Uncharacterized protein n=1 Tax=Dioscorea zingiberensis TaxID=325984 RepID=A0A9D5CKB3_9LILI|nr:hypothetical protein J5N97_016625 [Dioscorea zingiberensis]
MAGEAVLSAFMQVLFDKLATAAFNEYRLLRGAKKELKSLSSTLSMVQAVLEDAEEKQLTEKPVQCWLMKLKDIAYYIDELLDKHATADLESRLEGQKVSNHFHFTCYCWKKCLLDYRIAHKIKGVNKKLEKIARERDVLGLQVMASVNRLRIEDRPQTSSLVDGSNVFGREEDKERIVRSLLMSDRSSSFRVSVLPIVGMGGLGKTTLTQLVYNDNRIKEHFQLRMWVCVSENFDEKKLTRETLEFTVSGGYSTNTTNMNLLQEELFEKLKGKRYLLVLDDVWNENHEKWRRYYAALIAGERGSKIIVTTQNKNVGRIMGGSLPYHLKQLSDKDCWSLFRNCAFVDGDSSRYPKLEEIGMEIVKKLKGLPLAAKALGSLLYSKLDEDDWQNILRSEIWELPADQNNVLPALRLSYKHLPPNLKQCFAFCAVFHKDYVFERDNLVQIWMALGFIQPQGRNRMEDIGYSYFDDLVSRSFFQAHKGNYVMHDAIHVLAQSISIEECVRVEDGLQTISSKKARHLSFSCSNSMDTSFEQFYGFKRLRTLLLLQGYKSRTCVVPDDLFLKLKFLRVLDLHRRDIDKLPQSIGNLQLLRYLSLSGIGIKMLPSSICRLYNLQTLRLMHCEGLRQLPKDVTNLINLRHLEARTLLVTEISGIGKLASLQKLDEFVVRRSKGFQISELKDMVELRGNLRVSSLENVTSCEEAIQAKLSNKRTLTALQLEWSEKSQFGSQECLNEEVLRGLQPPTEIKELTIKGYSGFYFPRWLGSAAFSSLNKIHLSNCENCKFLPPLGQLPFLRSLDIEGMYSVTHIGQEFSGNGEVMGFPSLNELEFQDMPCLEEWNISEGETQLPCITDIWISECPKLMELPQLPSTVTRLTISEVALTCLPMLRPSSTSPAALSFLSIHDCLKLTTLQGGLLSQQLSFLEELTIANCEELVSLPAECFRPFVSLRKLHIYDCPKLTCSSLETTNLLPRSLEVLGFRSCSLEFINPMLKSLTSLTSLTHLKIDECPEFYCFPEEELPSMLKFLVLSNCANLQSVPPLRHVLKLESLVISDCPMVTCLPEDGLPLELQEVNINECPLLKDKLEQDGCEWEKIVHVPKVEINDMRR